MAESNGKDHGINGSEHSVETKEHGCFDFLAKNEGKTKHDVVMDETRKENKEDLTRLHSQTSSSSDDEFEGERKKNKTTLEDSKNGDDGKDIEVVNVDEKKGFLENIKAHLPGHHKKTEEDIVTPEATQDTNNEKSQENETKEKKGILEKIKEKLHKNDEDKHVEKKEN
ncbi:phosphoprotein ECPP44-like protein [Tanacetum coccineum]